jgi:hypothetical protein
MDGYVKFSCEDDTAAVITFNEKTTTFAISSYENFYYNDLASNKPELKDYQELAIYKLLHEI